MYLKFNYTESPTKVLNSSEYKVYNYSVKKIEHPLKIERTHFLRI